MSRALRALLLVLGLLAIFHWQRDLGRRALFLDQSYDITSSVGISHAARFFYFFYYLGHFPVATTAPLPQDAYSPAAAARLLREQADTLVMDFNLTWRSGDRGKIFLFYPDALLRGTAQDPSVRTMHRLAFTAALMALWTACVLCGQAILGVALVLLLGSNAFQLRQVHVMENVFSWTITTAVLVLALHAPLVFGCSGGRLRAKGRTAFFYALGVALASGALLGCVRTVRSEPVVIGIAAALTYLFMPGPGLRLRGRLLLCGALAGAQLLVGAALDRWFQRKHDQAAVLLKQIGGHPYPGPRVSHHELWHPIWCGLGDFDQKYGYRWDDRVAVDYAFPVMRDRLGVRLPPRTPGRYHTDEYWDEARRYPRFPAEVPGYHEVIRDKVLSDIRRDPGWYLDILGKRALRLLRELTPLRVQIRMARRTLPWHPLLLAPALLVLLAFRRGDRLALAAFTLPTCLTALLIYSDKGNCYYAIYHQVLCAGAAACLIEEGGRLTRALVHSTVRAWRAHRDPNISSGP
jgi:hypothetical protein